MRMRSGDSGRNCATRPPARQLSTKPFSPRLTIRATASFTAVGICSDWRKYASATSSMDEPASSTMPW